MPTSKTRCIMLVLQIAMVLNRASLSHWVTCSDERSTTRSRCDKPALVADRKEDYLVRGLANKELDMSELARLLFRPASKYVKMTAVLRG